MRLRLDPGVDRPADDVEDGDEREPLWSDKGEELLAVSSTPPRRIELEQPRHALASRLWPTRVTADMLASLARSAFSPSPVSS